MQELKDITTAKNAGTSTRKPATTLEEMFNTIGNNLSNLASSDDEQDGEDENDDEEDSDLRMLSDDDEPGWVMGTISKTVQHRMESFWQKQMRLDELTQPGWGDTANYFGDRDRKYWTAKLKVPVVVKPQIDMTAGTPSSRPFGEHMQTPDIFHRQLQMPAVTSRPETNQIWLGLEKPQSHKFILVLSPDTAPDWIPIQDAKPVEPVSCYPWMKHP